MQAQERHRTKLAAFSPEPTFVYSSGNGVVALWKYVEPVKLESQEEIEQFKAINVGIAQALGGKAEGYDHCQSLDHLLRLPHTLNIPDARKLAKGRKSMMAGDVVAYPERKYADFELPSAAPSIAPGPTEIGDAVTTDNLDELSIGDRLKEIITDGRVDGESKPNDDLPSAWRFEAVCGLIRAGIAEEVILGLLLDKRYDIGLRGNGARMTHKAAFRDIKKAHG